MNHFSPAEIHEAKRFHDFFEQIPAEKWATGTLYDEIKGTKCALGHLGIKDYGIHNDRQQNVIILGCILRKIIATSRIGNNYASTEAIYYTNDHGAIREHLRLHPKQKILAALELVINGNKQ